MHNHWPCTIFSPSIFASTERMPPCSSHPFLPSAIECLSVDDRKVPQISQILPMLKRGIGVHHSGLLPIVKEVIEIMFQEGLLKVLFATGEARGREQGIGARICLHALMIGHETLMLSFGFPLDCRDLLHRAEHAGQDRCVHQCAEVRRRQLPMGVLRRIHPNERKGRTPRAG